VLVTGEYGAAALAPVLDRLERMAGRPLRILKVRNDFFGGNVAVAGLVVGEDARRAIAGDTGPAGVYLVPDVALSGDTFLDGVTLAEVATATRVPVVAAETTAGGILEAVAR
jgi:hypothetical protein